MTDVEHLIEHYKELSETVSGEAAVGEENAQIARRVIAKIKADALREAARDMRDQVERATEHQRFTEHELIEGGVEHVLNEYAERIENGDDDD